MFGLKGYANATLRKESLVRDSDQSQRAKLHHQCMRKEHAARFGQLTLWFACCAYESVGEWRMEYELIQWNVKKHSSFCVFFRSCCNLVSKTVAEANSADVRYSSIKIEPVFLG